MKHFLTLLLLALSISIFTSCHKDDDATESYTGPSRTLLVYMAAENNLADMISMDVNEMLAAVPKMTTVDTILIFLDGLAKPAIYSITKETTVSRFLDLAPDYQYPAELNSSSKESLDSFLAYAREHTNSSSYGLLFWSHGSGWIPSTYAGDSAHFSKHRSFGIDTGNNTTSGNGSQLCITDMHESLKSFGKVFDYLMFDCCFMQTIEMDYELRDVAKYIIASCAEIPCYGANYTTLVPACFDMTSYPNAIPEAYYNNYKNNASYGVTISTVDCSQLDKLMTATAKVVAAHKDSLLAMSYDSVQDYFIYWKWRYISYTGYKSDNIFPDFYDMNAIFKMLLPQSEYNEWKTTFSLAVPYAYATNFWSSEYEYRYTHKYSGYVPIDQEQYGGLTMYVPLQKYSTDSHASGNAVFVNGYPQSSWAKGIGLDDVKWVTK